MYQTYFSLGLGDSTLEEYYAKFTAVYEELNIYRYSGYDTHVMRCQRENLNVVRFLFGLPTSFDPVCHQLLGRRELPHLSEVFSYLRQSSISNTTLASPLPPYCSALATSAFGGQYSGDFGRGGQESGGGGRDFGHEGVWS